MTDFFIGFRVEVGNRLVVKNLLRRINSQHGKTQAYDLHRDGKIVIEKTKDMLVAHGEKANKGLEKGLANFAVITQIKDEDQMFRIVRIVNVLGNDRLIRERVHQFVNGKSSLSSLPELEPIKEMFIRIERIIPGFIKSGWYYAPEAISK
jgi:hypothetical protein